MKLDLLYEIDSPRPWDAGPHPYGPAGARAARVRRDARPDEARRRARLQHRVVRRAPLPRGSLALPGARGRDRRAHPGDREHPARLRRDAAAVRVHPPGARRREGRDRRHPLAGSHRVGHRPLDADGADRVPRRPRGEPRRVGRGHRDHLRDVARGVLRVGQPHVPVPASPHHPEAVPGSAPARAGWPRRRKDRRPSPARTSSACCRSRSCSRSTRWPRRSTRTARRGTAPTRSRSPTSPPTRSRRTRSCTARRPTSRPATTASGSRSRGGTRTSPSSRSTGSSPTSIPRRRRPRSRS